MTPTSRSNGRAGKWWVCSLLLAALTLNYMDRQTLALTIVPIQKELHLTEEHYGILEKGFSYAFAVGGLLAGWLADKVRVRWMYPGILLAWSAAGLATGYADRIGQALAPSLAAWWPGMVDPDDPSRCAFVGFLLCRTALGFFEAGQWPCALITTQRLLAPADRPLGNGLLQSGASVGPILTPLVVQAMVTGEPGSWRGPFVAVGAIGLLWILPWTWFTAGGTSLDSPLIVGHHPSPAAAAAMQPPLGLLIRRCLALGILVVALNLTWHFFRAWLPKMLEEYYGYGAATVRYFTAGYYLAAGLGCILAGFAVKLLTPRLMAVHRARLTIFLACALLTALSTVVSGLGRGPLLLILLLVVSFGSLGLFPNYYSLTQEISLQHQGKLTGALGFLTWVAIGEMQHLVGQHLDRTHTYAACIFWAGLPPGVAFVALCLLWGGRKRPPMPYT